MWILLKKKTERNRKKTLKSTYSKILIRSKKTKDKIDMIAGWIRFVKPNYNDIEFITLQYKRQLKTDSWQMIYNVVH